MFIFDGINKKIKIDKDAANIKQVLHGRTWYIFDAVDLYSEWKRWCVFSDGAKYAPAFSVIGGEDIGGGLKVGSYVFLLSSNGYMLQGPDEDNVFIQISGNLYPDIANYPIIESNPVYSYTLIMRNSSLTQTSITSTSSELSTEQDAILRAIAPKLTTINEGVKKASILIPHNETI